MATYRVPQDVEADDKILGPFTIRQFVYLITVVISGWLTFIFAKNTITLLFVPLTLAPMLFFGLMVFLGVKNRSQPAEMYFAAIVRYFLKPHKRIWNQEGVIETVRITAPKKEFHQYSDNLSKGEVTSRLGRLADLMDSRGWAAKDVRYQPNIVLPQQPDDDERLLSFSQLPQSNEPSDVHSYEDVMDEQNSPVAQYFDQKIIQTQKNFKDNAMAHMNDPNFNPYPTDMHQRVVKPIDEDSNNTQNNAKLGVVVDEVPIEKIATPQPSPPIANLVETGGDNLSVSTLAKEAERLKSLEEGDEIDLS